MDGRIVKRLFGAALAVSVALSAVGCSDAKRADMVALEDENSELRGQIAALEGERAMWQDTKSKLEQENMELAQALEEMRAAGTVDDQGGLVDVPGATVSMRGSDLVVSVAGDVLFDSGKVTLKDSAKQTLDSVSNLLRSDFAANEVRIEGYTDTDPIRKSNWASNDHLSFERGHAVEKYLISRGIDTKRMYVAAFGPDRPKGSKAQSRRVEIVILGS